MVWRWDETINRHPERSEGSAFRFEAILVLKMASKFGARCFASLGMTTAALG
jgi:hypothetical protein